jgi:hypothetical protein
MKSEAKSDPCLYHGEIRAADGRKPYNGYLWPSECWTAEHGLSVPGKRPTYIDYDFRVEIFAVILRPGQPVIYSTSGHTYDLERGREYTISGEREGRQTSFATRTEAIRVSAARLIRRIRRHAREVRKDKLSAYHRTGIHLAPEIITWARQLVARETGAAEPKPISLYVPPPPPPVRQLTGLPLLDMMEGAHG